MTLTTHTNPHAYTQKSKRQSRRIRSLLVLGVLWLMMGSNASVANEFAEGGLLPSCYTYPAVAMTPYDRSIQDNLYRMTHEHVYHQEGQTGLVLLYGPVQPWVDMFGDGVRFSATFRDPDGPGEASKVVAELRFVGPGGIRIISTLNSNEHARATDDAQVMSEGISFRDLNRHDGYYLVRFYIQRDDTTLQPAAFGYNLCSAVF